MVQVPMVTDPLAVEWFGPHRFVDREDETVLAMTTINKAILQQHFVNNN